jgi:REP-associated tyrosine transposase
MRLSDYDYASAGAYFVTIVTQGRIALFGRIADDTVQLNAAGWVVSQSWLSLPSRFPFVYLDEFVVMPNHVYCIVWLGTTPHDLYDAHEPNGTGVGAGLAPPVTNYTPKVATSVPAPNAGGASPAPTLGGVIGAFKSISARQVNASFGRAGSVWQRSYFERVIRNQDELGRIRQYVLDNPKQWALDKNHVDMSS